MLSGPREVPERDETVTSQGTGIIMTDASFWGHEIPKSFAEMGVCSFINRRCCCVTKSWVLLAQNFLVGGQNKAN
jgi:hypothetical protein